MRSHSHFLLLLLCVLSTSTGGCAPNNLADGVVWTARQTQQRNAAFLAVRGMPGLRFDAFLLDRLAQVESAHDISESRARLTSTLTAARRNARYADNNEIDRLTVHDLEDIWHRYASEEPTPSDLREAVPLRFWMQVAQRQAAIDEDVQAAATVADVHRLARRVRAHVERSPKDHHGRGPMLAMVAASIHEEAGPLDRGVNTVDVYDPPPGWTRVGRRAPPDEPDTDRLLARYAPVIVQERRDPTPYDPSVDVIGTVELTGTADHPEVHIATGEPSIYAYAQATWIDGMPHLQLTYTYWFPAHPKLKRLDPEAGDIEGATLRITLDRAQRPAVFETVLNCGCYHRCYPSDDVERRACVQYGPPLPGKTFCVEQKTAGKLDWIVAETVACDAAGPAHPLLFSRAGYHGPAGISFDHGALATRTILHRRAYVLRCYDELEQLPVANGCASMFQTNGLVRGAARLEGKLMALTGMLSAGQPRQRGTQRLHWDQYDFDDPHLLEDCLRLPEGL